MKSLKAMPFDSNEIPDEATGEASFDRVAYSADLARWLKTYISNGVLIKGGDTLGNELKVTHKEALTVTVDTGAVCINGRTGWNDETCDLTVSMGGTYPRIDRVVAELNIPNDRDIYIKVLEGTPAEEPTAPELTQTDDVYQIPLAQVRVEASSASVASITDERAEHISNVTIGIKPPTGNDAVAVKVSEKTKELYGLSEKEAFVDNALQGAKKMADESKGLASYIAFCTNANTEAINSALGYNNEEMISGVGKAIAMLAWYLGIDREANPFAELQKCNNVPEIVSNKAAKTEFFNANAKLFARFAQYSYLSKYFVDDCFEHIATSGEFYDYNYRFLKYLSTNPSMTGINATVTYVPKSTSYGIQYLDLRKYDTIYLSGSSPSSSYYINIELYINDTKIYSCSGKFSISEEKITIPEELRVENATITLKNLQNSYYLNGYWFKLTKEG